VCGLSLFDASAC
jgi:hypothetical protein